MDSINKTIEDSFMETIISMSRNRYNYRNHRTMIKYKIDCKKMKECLDKDNNIHFLYYRICFYTLHFCFLYFLWYGCSFSGK